MTDYKVTTEEVILLFRNAWDKVESETSASGLVLSSTEKECVRLGMTSMLATVMDRITELRDPPLCIQTWQNGRVTCNNPAEAPIHQSDYPGDYMHIFIHDGVSTKEQDWEDGKPE
jgi:hypothetical protein